MLDSYTSEKIPESVLSCHSFTRDLGYRMTYYCRGKYKLIVTCLNQQSIGELTQLDLYLISCGENFESKFSEYARLFKFIFVKDSGASIVVRRDNFTTDSVLGGWKFITDVIVKVDNKLDRVRLKFSELRQIGNGVVSPRIKSIVVPFNEDTKLMYISDYKIR